MKPLPVLALILSVVVLPSPSFAQTSNPLSADVNRMYGMVKDYLVKSAEKVAEADYSFKPTPEVRSFGQLVGHVANAHYLFCSTVKGEKSPSAEDLEKKTAKADLIKALNDSISYCDGVYSAMTDADGVAKVKLPFGMEMSKLATLMFNVAHDNEHYGNMVTYMRIKGLVPPSSERRPSGQ